MTKTKENMTKQEYDEAYDLIHGALLPLCSVDERRLFWRTFESVVLTDDRSARIELFNKIARNP